MPAGGHGRGGGAADSGDRRPICKFDPNCYRTGADHLAKYRHTITPLERKESMKAEVQLTATATATATAVSPTAHHKKEGGGVQRTLFQHNFTSTTAAAAAAAASSVPVAKGGDSEKASPPHSPAIVIGGSPSKPKAHQHTPHQSPKAVNAAGTPKVASSSPNGGGGGKKRARSDSGFGANGGPGSPPGSPAGASVDDEMKKLLKEAPPPRSSLLGQPPSAASSSSSSTPSSLELVYEMPFPDEDMRRVLDVAKAARPDDPLCGLAPWRLVGPFEVLLNAPNKSSAAAPDSSSGFQFSSDAVKWRHWRFRWQPPELITFAVNVSEMTSEFPASGNTRGDFRYLAFHRDSPKEMPALIVEGRSMGNSFTILGSGKDLGQVFAGTTVSASAKPLLEKAFGEPLSRAQVASVVKKRNQKSLARTYHNLGIVVPYDKKTEVGYREAMFTLKQLKTLISAMDNGTLNPKQREDIDEQFQYADIANDECDFGLNVELGLNIFALVTKPNEVMWQSYRILEIAYMLLGYDVFRHILHCHAPVLAGKGGVVTNNI